MITKGILMKDIKEFLEKVLLGPAQNILNDFPEKCVDLVITSPP